MSYPAVKWALSQRTQTGNGKAVLIALASFADNQTGECFPRIEKLAEIAQISVRNVNRGIQELEEIGLIERSRTGRSNRYMLAMNSDRKAHQIRQPDASDTPKSDNLAHQIRQEGASDTPKPSSSIEELSKELTKELSLRAPEPPEPPPVASVEADVYRRARQLIPKRVGLVTEAVQSGMTFVEVAGVMSRYESGQIGDLEGYLRGCMRRARAGPAPPRKSHLMAVLDDMIERVRDDDRGSAEVREDGHGGIPATGTARR